MRLAEVPKLRFAHTPTPLWRHPALDALVGGETWVKRDDMNSGAAAGNKIRKLEYLLARAQREGADVVITCGGAQSNHARATAIMARALGMSALLMLRSEQPDREASCGNLFLDRLVGAELCWLTPGEYAERDARMEAVAGELRARGHRPFVIPEGGSNALGALGYVDAMGEISEQLALGLGGGPGAFDAVVHACGSGGTAAGTALGAALYGVAREVLAIAVCDDRGYFERRIASLVSDAQSSWPTLKAPVPWSVLDEYKGPGYGVASREQLQFLVRVARATGLVLDPVYSGKALFALSRLTSRPRRVLFLHTGGLPGLLAQPGAFDDDVLA